MNSYLQYSRCAAVPLHARAVSETITLCLCRLQLPTIILPAKRCGLPSITILQAIQTAACQPRNLLTKDVSSVVAQEEHGNSGRCQQDRRRAK